MTAIVQFRRRAGRNVGNNRLFAVEIRQELNFRQTDKGVVIAVDFMFRSDKGLVQRIRYALPVRQNLERQFLAGNRLFKENRFRR